MDSKQNFIAPVSETKVLDWDCFEDPVMTSTTTVKYMSTEVYPKVGSELGLTALSKRICYYLSICSRTG